MRGDLSASRRAGVRVPIACAGFSRWRFDRAQDRVPPMRSHLTRAPVGSAKGLADPGAPSFERGVRKKRPADRFCPERDPFHLGNGTSSRILMFALFSLYSRRDGCDPGKLRRGTGPRGGLARGRCPSPREDARSPGRRVAIATRMGSGPRRRSARAVADLRASSTGAPPLEGGCPLSQREDVVLVRVREARGPCS